MKILKLGRSIKEGIKNIARHRWLSLTTILTLTFSFYVISAILVLIVIGNLTAKSVEEKFNIAIDFNDDVSEAEILEAQSFLRTLSEVKSVEYVSKNKALDELLAIKDEAIESAVKEVGENPLLSSLIVVARESSQYETIKNLVENSSFKDKINGINYERNKRSIENLNKTVAFLKKMEIFLVAIFLLISYFTVANALRMNMYSRKQEFEVMRLVGASNLYIQVPSLVEGIFYGAVAALLSSLLILVTIKSGEFQFEKIFGRENFSFFYLKYLPIILAGNFLAGLFLGAVSSFLAIRKYLKI